MVRWSLQSAVRLIQSLSAAETLLLSLAQAHLGELALLIDEGDDVHGFVGDHVQGILVVCELDVQPVNALQVILLLLQLEHVPHEELLQVLVPLTTTLCLLLC